MKYLFSILFILNFSNVCAQSAMPELVIGKERLNPGIIFVFEGAIKDHVMPESLHLSENETNVHIEARVNWDTNDIPKGSVPNGFIPYLHINTKIINQSTGLSTFVDLLPHINLIDNFHYARNISLPGNSSDLYTVKFNILPPTNLELSFHNDWLEIYGEKLLNKSSFVYKNVDFFEIVKATRKR